MWRTGEYIWCSRCTTFIKQRVGALAKVCPGGTRQRRLRANLFAGRAPLAKAADPPVGSPARLTFNAWLGWKFASTGTRPPRAETADIQLFIEGEHIVAEES